MASELFVMNAARPGKKRRKIKVNRKKPRKKRAVARARKTPTIIYRTRPKKKRRGIVRAVAVRSRALRRKRSRSGGGVMRGVNFKNFSSQLQTGAINGAGAFSTDIVMGFVRPMLPQMLGYGPMRHVTRVGLGLLLGNFVGKLSPKFGNAITVGTATVAGYDFVKEFVGPMLPAGMVLGEYTNQMGEYVDQMGYINPAQVQSMSGTASGQNNEQAYYSGGGGSY